MSLSFRGQLKPCQAFPGKAKRDAATTRPHLRGPRYLVDSSGPRSISALDLAAPCCHPYLCHPASRLSPLALLVKLSHPTHWVLDSSGIRAFSPAARHDSSLPINVLCASNTSCSHPPCATCKPLEHRLVDYYLEQIFQSKSAGSASKIKSS